MRHPTACRRMRRARRNIPIIGTLASVLRGAVAQLGERLNGIQEVVGSIPISSTNLVNIRKGRSAKTGLFHWSAAGPAAITRGTPDSTKPLPAATPSATGSSASSFVRPRSAELAQKIEPHLLLPIQWTLPTALRTVERAANGTGFTEIRPSFGTLTASRRAVSQDPPAVAELH